MVESARSLALLNSEARRILFSELGVADALRFLGQFDSGSAMYATQRDVWQQGVTVEQIAADVEHWKRQQAASGSGGR